MVQIKVEGKWYHLTKLNNAVTTKKDQYIGKYKLLAKCGETLHEIQDIKL